MHNKNLMLTINKSQIQEQVINNLLDEADIIHIEVALNAMLNVFYAQICTISIEGGLSTSLHGEQLLEATKNDTTVFNELLLTYGLESELTSMLDLVHKCEECGDCGECLMLGQHVDLVIELALALLDAHEYQPQNRQFCAVAGNTLVATVRSRDSILIEPVGLTVNNAPMEKRLWSQN